MAIALRDTGSANGTSVQLSIATSQISGLADGDFVILTMHKDQGSGGSVFSQDTGTTGWTKLNEIDWASGGRNHSYAVWCKYITSVAGEPANWLFTSTINDDWSITAIAFSGVDSTTQIDAAIIAASGQDDFSPDAPNLLVPTVGDYVVTGWVSPCSGGTRAGATITAPTGFTLSPDGVLRTGSLNQMAYKVENWPVGGKVYGDWLGTGGGTDGTEEWITWTLGVKPAYVPVTGHYLQEDGSSAILQEAGSFLILGEDNTSTNIEVPVASLVLTGIAPDVSVSAGGNVTVTVPVASLVLTTFAPQVNLQVIPGVASLTITGLAPVIALAVIPPVASLTLTTFAPQVQLAVIPGTASLVTSGKVPVLQLVVIPATTALTLTTFVPGVGQPVTVIPGVASLTLSTFAPTVTATANVTVTPGVASLVITGLAPSALTPTLITVPVASLVLTTYAPALAASRSFTHLTLDPMPVARLRELMDGSVELTPSGEVTATLDQGDDPDTSLLVTASPNARLS